MSYVAIALFGVACAVGGAGTELVDTDGGATSSGDDGAASGDDSSSSDNADASPPQQQPGADASAPPQTHDASTHHYDSGSTSHDASTTTCGTMVGPTITASCHSCTNQVCQTNGCYGGYWCDTSTSRCHAPPTSCP